MATTKKTGGKFKKALKNIFIFPMSAKSQFRRLMIASTILFVGVVAFHLYFFQKVETQNIFAAAPVAAPGPSQTVNEKKMSMILQRFADKVKTRDEALLAKPPVAEPSK